MEFYNKPLTTGEAAQAFRVSLKTIQQWVDRGLLECWKTPGGHRRISPQSMADLQARLSAWSASRRRLLVVCDDSRRGADYVSILHAINPEHEVREANNGLQAMLQLVRWHPDVMLCDSPVAGIDFDTMVNTIKQDRELSRMHIILLTDLPNALPPALDGLISVLRKTAPPEELQQALTRLIAQPAARIPSAR